MLDNAVNTFVESFGVKNTLTYYFFLKRMIMAQLKSLFADIKKIFTSLSALLFTTSLAGKDIRVVLASVNDQKINAVRIAFEQRFPNDRIQVIPYAAASDIAAQPVGKDNAQFGITNRLHNIPSELSKNADYCIAIENYIAPMPHGKTWQDVGLVVVIDNHTHERVQVESAAVYVPMYYVTMLQQQSAQEKTGYSNTIGEIIQQTLTKPVDHHDWHALPEFGGVSRTTLLQDAISKALHADDIAEIKKEVTYYPNFPKPGVLFADFFPVMRNPHTLQLCADILQERYAYRNIDIIVGIESRGFLMGSILADRLKIGFVPVRKPNKLPGEVYTCTYEKEYGTDTLTLAKGSLQPGQRVLIVDDLIATGNSARAAINLVQQAGAEPVEFMTLLHVPIYAEEAQLDIPTFNLID